MPTISITSVVVNRDRRIRKEVRPEDVASLAESISRLGGLIHPIVLNRDNELIAGETRLEAHKHLGLDRIEFRYWDDLDEQTHLAIELEENIKRRDLPWQDQVDALRRFHELNRESTADWTVDKTAEAIGLSNKHVYDMLKVSEEIVKGNVRVAEAPQWSIAKNVTRRAIARAQADDLAKMDFVEDAKPDSPILNMDFLEWVHIYRGPPFNFLHCDFPYGIGADSFNQTANPSFGDYDDSFETYVRLINCLEENRDRLLGESAHCLFWFSMKHYEYTRSRLAAIFSWIDPYPLVWHKSDNKGTLPDPSRGPRRVYEVAFFCSHGDRKVIAPVSNVFAAPTVRLGEHMSEKSEDMLEYFFRMGVDSNTRLLDPTCGSGSALRAGRRLGATVLGLEMNEEFANNARRAWEA